jgi:hypothetical protein
MYRKITGAVTNKNFGIAGLPPELDELYLPPKSASQMRAFVAAAAASRPHLTRLRFAREVARSDPAHPTNLRVSSCTCSILIAASTAIRAASFA